MFVKSRDLASVCCGRPCFPEQMHFAESQERFTSSAIDKAAQMSGKTFPGIAHMGLLGHLNQVEPLLML